MSIINDTTKVLVQGITGKEGQRATMSMLASGIKVVCGVTPGKGGQRVGDCPVFDSVQQAMEYDSEINTSVLYVPPLMVLDAVLEAITAGITTLVIVTENVPVPDSIKILQEAKKKNCLVIGPSSVGVLDTKRGKLGSIGSSEDSKMYSAGRVGIISKSGGMCAETALILTQAGLGQSTVVGIGGDQIIGSNFVDILKIFAEDKDTEAVVIFGEIGGYYEQQIADLVKSGQFNKPIVAFISGQFAETINRHLALGHAGAIIEGKQTTSQAKKEILKQAGVLVADFHHQIPELVKQVLKK